MEGVVLPRKDRTVGSALGRIAGRVLLHVSIGSPLAFRTGRTLKGTPETTKTTAATPIQNIALPKCRFDVVTAMCTPFFGKIPI